MVKMLSSWFDPRNAGQMWRWWLFFFLTFSMPLVYGALIPVQRETKGPLYQAIRDPKNLYLQNNERVDYISQYHQFQIAVFELVSDSNTITPYHFRLIYDLTRELEVKGWTVVSGGNYWKKGWGEEPSATWIPYYFDPEDPEILTNWQRWLSSFLAEACENKAICGAGKIFSPDGKSISLAILIDGKKNEVWEIWRLWKDLAITLGGLQFEPGWKGSLQEAWYDIKYGLWEYDMPSFKVEGGTFYFKSWAGLRTGIVFGFFRDTRIKSLPGYALAFFFIAARFRFCYQYFLPIWLSLILLVLLTTGSIWPLHLVGLFQNPYSLPPLITVVIVGFSFFSQMMEMVWMLRVIEPDPVKRWRQAREITASSMNHITLLTTISSLSWFWFIDTRIALGMEAMFLFGTLFAWLIYNYFLPSLFFFFVRNGERERELGWIGKPICMGLEKTVAWLNQKAMRAGFFLYAHIHIRRWLVHPTPTVLLAVAALLFALGYFITVSQPVEYLPSDSNHRKTAEWANATSGSDGIAILFGKPSLKSCLFDEACAKDSLAFQERIEREVKGVKGTFSISQELEYQMLMDRRHNPLSPTPSYELAQEVVLDGESETNPRLPSHFNPSGYVLILAFYPINNSGELGYALGQIEEIAEGFRVAGYEILVHGEIPYFPLLAQIIPDQFPQFVGTSLFVIFFYAFFFLGRGAGNGYTISPWLIGWVLAQSFLLTSGLIGISMVIFHAPLDMATAAILPTVIACTVDSCLHPTLRFLQLLKEGMNVEEALKRTFEQKGEAVVVDGIGNSTCLSILPVSSFRPVFYLGVFSILALWLCISWSLATTLPLLAAGVRKKEEKHGHAKVYQFPAGGRRDAGVRRRMVHLRLW